MRYRAYMNSSEKVSCGKILRKSWKCCLSRMTLPVLVSHGCFSQTIKHISECCKVFIFVDFLLFKTVLALAAFLCVELFEIC